ncbi:MAG: PilZ domain-containing protein [Hyphomonadaceae bacterium]|nr:PilZ domain-containing protein [Hyphomonadaceae bacterium]
MSANAAIPLSSALQRYQSLRATPQERRRFRRLRLVVGGRLMDESGRESDCRTEDVSPGDVRIASPANLPQHSRVVLYLDEIGRVSGRIVRVCGDREYAIVFDASTHKKEKLAERLTWLVSKDALKLTQEDAPPAPRAEGRGEVEIEIDGGGTIVGEAIDFSLAGVTVRTPQPAPRIGSWVRVGAIDGRVSRLIEGGFAIDFTSLAPREPMLRDTSSE